MTTLFDGFLVSVATLIGYYIGQCSARRLIRKERAGKVSNANIERAVKACMRGDQ